MDFHQTTLPDKHIFREAFAAGWARYLAQYGHNDIEAGYHYMRGPVSMARLIRGHGGAAHEIAAAAALAGPSLFSQKPVRGLNVEFMRFSREVCATNVARTGDLVEVLPRLSDSARLFLQASAVMLVEQLAVTGFDCNQNERLKIYSEALDLYAVSRGARDKYGLDARFEAAAQKVTAEMDRPSAFGGVFAPSCQRISF